MIDWTVSSRIILAVAAAWAACLGAVAAQPLAGEARLALVIGNSAYQRSPLPNPVNDVRLMETTLREAGFQVIKAENASRRDMQRLLRDFGERLKQSGGVGLFYFAGHGVQVRGANYLIPVDADIRSEDEVAYDALDAQAVLDKMESARNRVNLVILDACRDNPFVRSRSAAAGLATMTAPSGSLVAYATAPGAVASDGQGKNGLYTEHLARALLTPGLPVEEVFKQVRSAVRRDSNGQQTPWENTALEGQFYFRPAAAGTDGAGAAQADLALWNKVKGSMSPGEVAVYVSRFPGGVFADIAKARIAALERLAAERTPGQGPDPRLAAAPGQPASAAVEPSPAAPAVASAVVAAAAPAAAAVESGGGRSILVVRDRLTGKSRELGVQSARLPDGGMLWSTGEETAGGGELRAVRIGDHRMLLVNGSLWTFPLVAGKRGDAVVQVDGQFMGGLQWEVTSRTNNRATVEAFVEFDTTGSRSQGTRRGKWMAEYLDGSVLPMNFRMDLRGYMGGTDLLSGELRNDHGRP